MKTQFKFLIGMLILFSIVFGLIKCSVHDQVLDLNTPIPVLSTDTLISVYGTATLNPIGGEKWDGTIEPVWNNAIPLQAHAIVPDLGNNTFTGFVGNATDITIRSLYDANNIYFLVEFDAGQENVKSAQWYFDPVKHSWAQELTVPSLNSDGITYRPAFIQDQFVIAFNVNNSCKSFNSLSCYAACHKNSTFGNPTTIDGGVMSTNGPNEVLDVWRARTLQVMGCNQANDCFIDDGSSVGLGLSGTLNQHEVHSDWQINNGSASTVPQQYRTKLPADGGFANKQSLKITGKSLKTNVPIWVIPTANYSNSMILLKDTLPGGAAVKVKAVDSNGVLTLTDGTIIDPRIGTDYQQIGSGDGPKCIPGSIVDIYTGSRGDVTANAYYTGSGWRILLKRALKTSDSKYDIDFSSLNDQPFGIGFMFNGADNQHANVNGLTLHFKK